MAGSEEAKQENAMEAAEQGFVIPNQTLLSDEMVEEITEDNMASLTPAPAASLPQAPAASLTPAPTAAVSEVADSAL